MFGALGSNQPTFGAGAGAFGAQAQNQDPNPNTRPSTDPATASTSQPDVAVSPSPSDGVSSLNFSPAPNSNLLIATSWSSDVLCWDVSAQGAVAKSQQKHELPVLDSSWSPDGTKVFTAGCDKQIKMWDLAANQFTQIGVHAAPARCVRAVNHPQAGLVVASGSWDKTVKYWDTRSPNPIATVDVGERVYAMDARHSLMVVGTADRVVGTPPQRERKIHLFDIINAPQQVQKEEQSPLMYQTRTIAVFPNQAGYLVGSIEGRVAVQNFDGMVPNQQSYTFKCHRRPMTKDHKPTTAPDKRTANQAGMYDEVHAVNVIKFHPSGTFVTGGADGVYIFWDKDAKARLTKPSEPCGQSISAGSFSSGGQIFAYAVSDDWSQGHAHHDHTKATNTVYLHRMAEKECTPRGKATK